MICVKIFKHWLEFSVSASLRFNFYFSLLSSYVMLELTDALKFGKEKSTSQSSGFTDIFESLFGQNYEPCNYSLANVRLESFENWTFCLARCHFYVSFVGLWKDTQMAKKFVKVIGRRYVCCHICRRNHSFSLRQNISNLFPSIFVFLALYYDKIFKHWPESSSTRLRVIFFIAFVHK